MKLVLSGLILTKIRELVTEIVKILDELFELLLLGIGPVNKLQVLLLHVRESRDDSLPLGAHLSEHILHLTLVVAAELLPHFKDRWLEIAVDIAHSSFLLRDTLCCRLWLFWLGRVFLDFLRSFLSTFFLSPLFLLLFFFGFLRFLQLSPLLFIEEVVNLLLYSQLFSFLSLEHLLQDTL